MVEIKHKYFKDAVPIMPSMWVMGWESMKKGEIRFPWVHPLW